MRDEPRPRRTFKTLAGKAGVSKEIRDRLQNHALQDVSSKNYDHWHYMPEKRAGMAKWDKFVRAMLASKRDEDGGMNLSEAESCQVRHLLRVSFEGRAIAPRFTFQRLAALCAGAFQKGQKQVVSGFHPRCLSQGYKGGLSLAKGNRAPSRSPRLVQRRITGISFCFQT